MSSPHVTQYGELRPSSSWDSLASLGNPGTFQWVSRLGSITARNSSSGHQPNFAALNRGRHLYSAGRPSRWALAHILVFFIFFCTIFTPPTIRHHLSNDNCLEDKRENYLNCSVLCCVWQLCTVICTHKWAVIKDECWFSFRVRFCAFVQVLAICVLFSGLG